MSEKNIIFDLDGTLFRTETVDIDAFNLALADIGYEQKSSADILALIGFPLNTICMKLLGKTSKATIERLSERIKFYEEKLIWEKGQLYSDVIHVLSHLKEQGNKLCICSNGNKEYVECIAEKFKLDRFFEYIRYKKYGVSKSRAVRILSDKFGKYPSIMVGDTLSDFRASSGNCSYFVWAAYGFGIEEIKGADFRIDNLDGLIRIVDELEAHKNNG